MKLTRRDYSPGDLLTVHDKGGSSVKGVFVRRTRRYVQLEEYSVEAQGGLVRMTGDRLLVPVETVRLIEVVTP